MRGAKCDICGGIFPRRDMPKVVLPAYRTGDLRRRFCPEHWRPMEAAWRQMLSEQAGPRPDPPAAARRVLPLLEGDDAR